MARPALQRNCSPGHPAQSLREPVAPRPLMALDQAGADLLRRQ
jgi:hypothetical protein